VSAITFYLCHSIIDTYQEVGGLRKQFVFNSIRLRALKHSLISAIPAPLRVVGSTNLALSGRHRKLSRPVKTYLGSCIIDLFPRRVSGSAVIVWHSEYAGGPDSDRIAASHKCRSNNDRDYFARRRLSFCLFLLPRSRFY